MKPDSKPPTRRLTIRQLEFAAVIATGAAQAEAYRKVYERPDLTNQTAAERSSRLAADPRVRAEVARIRAKSERKKLLTLNDRLAILAEIAQDAKTKAHDKTRAIDVYSRISGDQAPERHEHSGPAGGPLPIAATVATRTMSRSEKVAAIKAARAGKGTP